MKVTLTHKDVTKALQQYVAHNFGPNMAITGLTFDVTRNPRTVAFEVELQNADHLSDEERAEAARIAAGEGEPGKERAPRGKKAEAAVEVAQDDQAPEGADSAVEEETAPADGGLFN